LNEKEKEKKILGFIYRILTDKRNQNRYFSAMYGDIIEGKIVRLGDCLKYLEDKLVEGEKKDGNKF